MFSFNYKIVPVNEAKNVYKLTPTLGTYVKAFAPTLVFVGIAVAGTLFANHEDEQIEKLNQTDVHEDD
jgi:hypothetical protein